jgi:hypothetical protein
LPKKKEQKSRANFTSFPSKNVVPQTEEKLWKKRVLRKNLSFLTNFDKNVVPQIGERLFQEVFLCPVEEQNFLKEKDVKLVPHFPSFFERDRGTLKK